MKIVCDVLELWWFFVLFWPELQAVFLCLASLASFLFGAFLFITHQLYKAHIYIIRNTFSLWSVILALSPLCCLENSVHSCERESTQSVEFLREPQQTHRFVWNTYLFPETLFPRRVRRMPNFPTCDPINVHKCAKNFWKPKTKKEDKSLKKRPTARSQHYNSLRDNKDLIWIKGHTKAHCATGSTMYIFQGVKLYRSADLCESDKSHLLVQYWWWRKKPKHSCQNSLGVCMFGFHFRGAAARRQSTSRRFEVNFRKERRQAQVKTQPSQFNVLFWESGSGNESFLEGHPQPGPLFKLFCPSLNVDKTFC